MKTNVDDSVNANIVSEFNSDETRETRSISGGLTKRELFAAMAMQGMISSEQPDQCLTPIENAKYSVKCADALITALNKEKSDDHE